MQHRAYHFSDFRLDPGTHELCRAGEAVPLAPHAFDCLVYLIEHRDRVVGRDELMAAVWGKANVTDDQLYHVVRTARRALGERGDTASAIKTVPRVGFRWTREVRVDVDETHVVEADGQVRSAAATLSPASSAGTGKWREVVVPGLLAIALLAAAGIAVWYRHAGMAVADATGDGVTTPAQASADAVAVLPVAGAAVSNPEWIWLRLGLMDFIARRLRDGQLSVVPSGNVVALVQEGERPDATTDDVRVATNACCVVLPTATRTDGGWVVRLEWRRQDDDPRQVEARADGVIDAARQAADRLLDLIGKPAPLGPAAEVAAAELFQRAESAALTGHFAEARRLLETAPPSLRASAELRLRLARIDLQAGEFALAHDRFTALLDDAQAEGDTVLRARIANGLCAAGARLDRLAEADRQCTEAIDMLAPIRDSEELGLAYFRRGGVRIMQGRFDEAGIDLSKARIALELNGDTLGVARVEVSEAALDMFLGRDTEALPLLERAARQFDRFGAVADFAIATINQVSIRLEQLQSVDALRIAAQARPRLADLTNPLWRNTFEWHHARALAANGRLVEARTMLDELTHRIDPAQEAGLLGSVQTAQAELGFATGDFEAAADLARHAVQSLTQPRDMVMRKQAWLTRIRALRALQRDAEARTEVQAFAEWARDSNPFAAPYAKLAQAEQAWIEGRREDATQEFDSLVESVRRSGSPSEVASVAHSYGTLLLRDGHLEQAAGVIGLVAKYADQDFDSAMLQVRLYQALGQQQTLRAALDRARALAGERLIPATP